MPYYLTRPVYVLAKEPLADDKTKAKYSLRVEYVPDLSSAYAVNINPAFLTEAKFTLAFGERGQLTSNTSTSTEKLTPTVDAIGDFAVRILGVAASAVGGAAPPSQAAMDAIEGAPLVALLSSDPATSRFHTLVPDFPVSSATSAEQAELARVALSLANLNRTLATGGDQVTKDLDVGIGSSVQRILRTVHEQARGIDWDAWKRFAERMLQEEREKKGVTRFPLENQSDLAFSQQSATLVAATGKLKRDVVVREYRAAKRDFEGGLAERRKVLPSLRDRMGDLPPTAASSELQESLAESLAAQEDASGVWASGGRCRERMERFDCAVTQRNRAAITNAGTALDKCLAYSNALPTSFALLRRFRGSVSQMVRFENAKADTSTASSLAKSLKVNWRIHRVEAIRRELDPVDAQLGIIGTSCRPPPGAGPLCAEKRRLESEMDVAYGISELVERAGSLRSLLATIATTGGRQGYRDVAALKDYEIAREQLDAVETAIATKKAALDPAKLSSKKASVTKKDIRAFELPAPVSKENHKTVEQGARVEAENSCTEPSGRGTKHEAVQLDSEERSSAKWVVGELSRRLFDGNGADFSRLAPEFVIVIEKDWQEGGQTK